MNTAQQLRRDADDLEVALRDPQLAGIPNQRRYLTLWRNAADELERLQPAGFQFSPGELKNFAANVHERTQKLKQQKHDLLVALGELILAVQLGTHDEAVRRAEDARTVIAKVEERP